MKNYSVWWFAATLCIIVAIGSIFVSAVQGKESDIEGKIPVGAKTIDSEGNETIIEFDEEGRKIREESRDEVFEYAYNSDGNLIAIYCNGVLSEQWRYDDQGRECYYRGEDGIAFTEYERGVYWYKGDVYLNDMLRKTGKENTADREYFRYGLEDELVYKSDRYGNWYEYVYDENGYEIYCEIGVGEQEADYWKTTVYEY